MPTPLQLPSGQGIFAGRGLACRRGERLVFHALDFTLAAGGLLLLTGPNGSGKSSLLRLMAGLTPAAAGSLDWDGQTIAADPAAHRARLVFIGHQDALKPGLTAAETLAFWGGMRGGHAAAAGLARFRLLGLADWPCRLLSAGQRRRLALARLVAGEAELWLLDEPTTGLDAEATATLLALVTEHCAAGGRAVISTHLALPLAAARMLSLADFQPAPGQ